MPIIASPTASTRTSPGVIALCGPRLPCWVSTKYCAIGAGRTNAVTATATIAGPAMSPGIHMVSNQPRRRDGSEA
jgi:hypothetical protein